MGALLVGIVSGLAGFLAQFVTKKIAFGVAVVASLGTIVTGMFVTVRALVGTINVATNDPWIQIGLAIAIPSNADVCLTALAGTWAACTLYAWQRQALDLFAKVS